MFLKIEISEYDFNAICNSSMSVGDMFNTVKGRVYRAIINGDTVLTKEPYSYGSFYVDGQKYDMTITKHKEV